MIKHFVRFILLGVVVFLDIFSILKECELWFDIKFFKEILIAIGIIIGVLTIIAAIIFLKIPLTTFKKIIKILIVVTVVLFFTCSTFSQLKIGELNIERGTYLYDKYSNPTLFCFISGWILIILEGVK